MKQALKLIGVFLLSAMGGFALAVAGVVLFTDLTLEEYLTKFASIELLEIAGVMLFSIASLLLSILLQIILHEGGHLICGVVTGYKFVSFRIFNFTIIRKDGKLSLKRFKIAGTGGQCLLAPPQKPIDEIPTVLYNAGGFIFNIIASAIALYLFYICNSALWNIFFLMFGLTGLFIALINGIPMKVSGIGNDGRNMVTLGKNPKAKRAMVIQLEANAMIVEGFTPIEMPQEWFVTGTDSSAENIYIDKDLDYSDAISLTIELMKISFIMDLRDNIAVRMEQAHKLLEEIYSHRDKIIGLLVNETATELLFTALVTGRTDLAKTLYTPDLKKYIDNYKGVMSSKVRTLWAIALFMENNKEEADNIYRTLLERKEDYLMQGEVKMDISLIERISSNQQKS